MKRLCLEPGCVSLTSTTRCTIHERQRQRARNLARPERRTSAYQRYMRQSKQAWIATHGTLCNGYGHQPPHLVAEAELTMDHVVPLARGGDPFGPVVGRCRPCNSTRGTNG
jgi:hypothetical protein